MQFPQYRRYSDCNTYFKIINSNQFVEYKKVGDVFTVSEIDCKLFPEKMFVNDLLICEFENVQIIDELIYTRELKKWADSLKQFKF